MSFFVSLTIRSLPCFVGEKVPKHTKQIHFGLTPSVEKLSEKVLFINAVCRVECDLNCKSSFRENGGGKKKKLKKQQRVKYSKPQNLPKNPQRKMLSNSNTAQGSLIQLRWLVQVQCILAKLNWKPTRECGFRGNAFQREQSYRTMRVCHVALCNVH